MSCQNCEQLEDRLKNAVDAQCQLQNDVFELQRRIAQLNDELNTAKLQRNDAEARAASLMRDLRRATR